MARLGTAKLVLANCICTCLQPQHQKIGLGIGKLIIVNDLSLVFSIQCCERGNELGSVIFVRVCPNANIVHCRRVIPIANARKVCLFGGCHDFAQEGRVLAQTVVCN
jgi:hypothetical protein